MKFKFVTNERSRVGSEQRRLAKERAAIASHSTAVVDKPWDGPAAVADAPNDATVLRYMHAWYAGDNPTQKGSYKFPHHAPGTDTPANINGVNNAMARLANADIPDADRAGVRRHLERHQNDWKAKQKTNPELDIRQARENESNPSGGRMVSFPGELRYQVVQRNGKDYFEVEGYATVFDTPYEMYDFFGPFTETVRSDALDISLASKPDVAFLVNHKGITMARTTNGSLELIKDSTGLGVHAFLNVQRTDVKDLMSAITDELVDQMSFAFMLEDGEWNDTYDEFTITKADINRGDVSAVNYGANPYTSIWARAKEWANEAEEMPTSVQRAVVERLVPTLTGVQIALDARSHEYFDDDEHEDFETFSEERSRASDNEPLHASVALYRNKLLLENE